jgi:hypothetical protein
LPVQYLTCPNNEWRETFRREDGRKEKEERYIKESVGMMKMEEREREREREQKKDTERKNRGERKREREREKEREENDVTKRNRDTLSVCTYVCMGKRRRVGTWNKEKEKM